ncbi:LDCC motif putative metal-binding protein [Acidaminobacter sp.]|nr:LDCC motif putative metal-binding protein [Acidaminobacter sp.]
MLTRLKKRIMRFLTSIAAQNKSSFGEQRMDCCDLNKK